MVSDVIANYNLDKSGNPQSQGAPVNRRYGLDWYEFYGQDTNGTAFPISAGVTTLLQLPPHAHNLPAFSDAVP
jgi:hypothetical protein